LESGAVLFHTAALAPEVPYVFKNKKLPQPIPECPVTQSVALDIAFVIINSGAAFKP